MTAFILKAEYRDFVGASKKDEFIQVLGEVNGMYRTLCSLFILLLLSRFATVVENRFPFLRSYNAIVMSAVLAVVFLFAYRKQTQYLVKRIKLNAQKTLLGD